MLRWGDQRGRGGSGAPWAPAVGAAALPPAITPASPRSTATGVALPGCPKMEGGSGPGWPRVPLVYVNSFGAHRCGTVIRYGWARGAGGLGGEGGPGAGAPRRSGDARCPSPSAEPPSPAGRGRGRPQAVRSYRSTQPMVWLRVWKVISKMLEENEKFRSRLLTCSQCNGEDSNYWRL
uniref:Uncharacterized protein n=1 Tax=Apteryx owenii TaxID=8824 RepID=A0A8B9SAB2_APTOW